jgi:hypothetical protein
MDAEIHIDRPGQCALSGNPDQPPFTPAAERPWTSQA